MTTIAPQPLAVTVLAAAPALVRRDSAIGLGGFPGSFPPPPEGWPNPPAPFTAPHPKVSPGVAALFNRYAAGEIPHYYEEARFTAYSSRDGGQTINIEPGREWKIRVIGAVARKNPYILYISLDGEPNPFAAEPEQPPAEEEEPAANQHPPAESEPPPEEDDGYGAPEASETTETPETTTATTETTGGANSGGNGGGNGNTAPQTQPAASAEALALDSKTILWGVGGLAALAFVAHLSRRATVQAVTAADVQEAE